MTGPIYFVFFCAARYRLERIWNRCGATPDAQDAPAMKMSSNTSRNEAQKPQRRDITRKLRRSVFVLSLLTSGSAVTIEAVSTTARRLADAIGIEIPLLCGLLYFLGLSRRR